jgi:hypothetical protein
MPNVRTDAQVTLSLRRAHSLLQSTKSTASPTHLTLGPGGFCPDAALTAVLVAHVFMKKANRELYLLKGI